MFLKLHVTRYTTQGQALKELMCINTDKIVYAYIDDNGLPFKFRMNGDPSLFIIEDENEKWSLKNIIGS